MEKIEIKGINYRLNEETLTAEVIAEKVYEGDIIIPETVVFNELTYRVEYWKGGFRILRSSDLYHYP